MEVYFHCSNTEGMLISRAGVAVSDLTEAREHATQIMQSMIMTPNDEDWRNWVLYVSGVDGEEFFELPFTSMLGRPH